MLFLLAFYKMYSFENPMTTVLNIDTMCVYSTE